MSLPLADILRDDILPPAPHIPRAMTAAGVVMDVERVAGIVRDQKVLSNAGLSVGGEFFALGTRIAGSGDTVMRELRKEAAALPFVEEGLSKFQALVQAEDRQHVTDLMLPHLIYGLVPGKTTWEAGFWPAKGGKYLTGVPSRTAWKNIGTALDVGGLSSYLPIAPNEIRKAILAAHAPKIDKDKRASIGTRRIPGSDLWQIFRVAGPRYLPLEPQMIVNALRRMLPKSWKVEVDYDGEAWTIDVFDMSPRAIGEGDAVGDVFRVGLRIKGDDVRRGSFVIQSYALRIRCLNGTILTSVKEGFRRRHVGKVGNLEEQIATSLRKLAQDFAHFTEAWGTARKTEIMGNDAEPGEVFGALVDMKLLDLPGGRDEVIARCVQAWSKEPGHTVAALTNAITRAAHETDWWHSLDSQTAAEEQGTQLLYVKNLVHRVGAQIVESRHMIELT